MLIAGINGSPHAGRNTGTLINQVLKGAESEGSETLMYNLGDMEINPCRACMACKENKPCVRHDNMLQFFEKAKDIDGLVMGTPIYFDHISAQLKIFIDRLYCYIGSGLEDYYLGGKRAVICITYGAGDPDMYDYVLDWMKERLSFYFNIKTVGMLKKGSCPHTPIVDKDTQLMEEAFELGKKLCQG